MSQEEKQIVDNLKPYHPEKVILFGSYAWGKPNKDSDRDILIIKETQTKPFKRIPEARKYLQKVNFPLDVLVFTPHEIKNSCKEGDFFIKDVVKNGKIIYEE